MQHLHGHSVNENYRCVIRLYWDGGSRKMDSDDGERNSSLGRKSVMFIIDESGKRNR